MTMPNDAQNQGHCASCRKIDVKLKKLINHVKEYLNTSEYDTKARRKRPKQVLNPDAIFKGTLPYI